MAEKSKEEKAAQKAADAEAAKAAEAAAKKSSEPEYVEFVEFFAQGREVTRRVLLENDFKDATGEVMEGVGDRTWDISNGWKIPLEDFQGHIGAMREFVDRQHDFRIVKVEKPADEG